LQLKINNEDLNNLDLNNLDLNNLDLNNLDLNNLDLNNLDLNIDKSNYIDKEVYKLVKFLYNKNKYHHFKIEKNKYGNINKYKYNIKSIIYLYTVLNVSLKNLILNK
jgi:uncharacterized protein YjbI with pentapeptide repeats